MKFLTPLSVFMLAAAVSVLSPLNPRAQAASQDLVDKIDKLENRVDELDVQKTLSRVQISGTLINRYEMLDSTTGVPGTDEPRSSIRAPITYLGLNADANVSNNIKVYTKLAFSKFWQQENRYELIGDYQATETGSFGLSGSTARFDRAYATYDFDRIPLTIAMGRMATNNGEPINQHDGLPRMGTYPRLAYNGIFDGVALIYDFSKYLPKNNSFVLRMFMTPFDNVSMTSRTLQQSDVDNNGNGVTIDSSTPQWAFLAEYTRDNLKWLGRFTFDFFMYNYYHFYNDGNDGSEQSSPVYNGGTQPPGNASFSEDARAESLYLGFEDIAYTGLNFDVSALFVHSKFPLIGTAASSAAFLINLNKKFEKLHNLVVGGEYIHTDPNYYLDEYTILNLIPFYQTPNTHGYHIYASMPVTDHVVVRVGTYQAKTEPTDYSISGGSPTTETNWHSVYTQARIDF